ncbi:uncharacterized protein LOC114712520 [Neltuma alba]|uniref:uncharacterized protein LOC114712520 n=1 Tax=Neltuma alba TaxID=207710 RepID=UPI0010A2CBA8|nr:uncharacterized protein LOC114712520 [Prosopis alba]
MVLKDPVISNGGAYTCEPQTNGWDGECRNDGLSSAAYGADHLFVSKLGMEEQAENNFPSRLVQQSESLLERLKSLEKSRGILQDQDSLSKYILEIEIRLSDFRSLASHGSSLLPFWVHSDKRIKQLESVINNDLLQTFKSARDEVEDAYVHVSEGLDGHQKGIGHEFEVDDAENKNFVTSEFSNSSQVDGSVLGDQDTCNEPPINAEHIPSASSPGSQLEIGGGYNKNVDTMVPPEELTHTHGSNVGEDVDMDVDMEVEDLNSSGNVTVVDMPVMKGFVQTEQSVQGNLAADHHSVLPEDEFVVPPPPDDEWIPPPPPDIEQVPPPPPPDDEQMPPPPPDEPSVSTYTAVPSYPEAGQSLSYPQYNLAYPGASSEYYGHAAAEIPGSTIYGHAEGCQIAMPPAQLYYSAVPISYGESSQVIVNSAEPVPYYEHQDGTDPRSLPHINNSVLMLLVGLTWHQVMSLHLGQHQRICYCFG